ncbi:MAG: hypothetical protein NT062_00315 [Proteobacteria bacterium]|nr:hypothetical protein [Pseudomonadota bacterium]
MGLVQCERCNRHIRDENQCPFCGAGKAPLLAAALLAVGCSSPPKVDHVEAPLPPPTGSAIAQPPVATPDAGIVPPTVDATVPVDAVVAKPDAAVAKPNPKRDPYDGVRPLYGVDRD